MPLIISLTLLGECAFIRSSPDFHFQKIFLLLMVMGGIHMKTIKDMPVHSRPREKLQEKGVEALSDEELVQAILGMGTAGRDVRAIAKQVAALIREKQKNLSLADLLDVPGMGLAKAAQILSAFELARRHLIRETVKISSAQDVLPLISDLIEKRQEHFLCISLNGANEVIEKRIVTVGLLNMSPVHPREVFADVIVDRAAAVILVHNHPSGDLQPSDADLKMHEQLTEAGNILGIRVLDQIIISRRGYLSFQEAGIMK
jgi:DNA repair protein RadC